MIAIIAVLIELLLSAAQKVRTAARVEHQNNTKRVALAAHNYNGARVAAGSAPRLRAEERFAEVRNCTTREDRFREVNRLATDGRFDHLPIESTGVGDLLSERPTPGTPECAAGGGR